MSETFITTITKLSTPSKVSVKVDAQYIKNAKEKKFNAIKDQIEIPGFRKGTITREIAESKLGVEKLYRSIIDEIFYEVKKQHSIVHAEKFMILGTLKDNEPLDIEFIAELKPTVKLVELDKITLEYNPDSVATEEEIKCAIELAQKELETLEDSDKKVLDNLDIAILDFQGTLEGEKEPFKGGTAKNFKIVVNKIVNGQKQFIDTFEDQLVGMTIDETRNINVSFPDDYRDKTKCGKKVTFVVTLKAIKKSIIFEGEDLAKGKGFSSYEEFNKYLKQSISDNKQKSYDDDFKKTIINTITSKCEISPLPSKMVEDECERQWMSYLTRLGKTEEELIKQDKYAKERFFDNNFKTAVETIKTSLVFESIAADRKMDVSLEEIKEYLTKVFNIFQYSQEKRDNLFKKLETNQQQFETTKVTALNEKVMEFLFSYFKGNK